MTSFNQDDIGAPSEPTADYATVQAPASPQAAPLRTRPPAANGAILAVALIAVFGAGIAVGRIDLAPSGSDAAASAAPEASVAAG